MKTRVNYITDEMAMEAEDIAVQEGSNVAAARVLGIAESSVRRRRKRAAEIGYNDYTRGDVVPTGQRITGLSTYFPPDPETGQPGQWVKTKIEPSLMDVLEAVEDFMEGYDGAAQLVPAPLFVDTDLLTVYPIADHHLGMYAWKPETGDDYDLDIAAELLRNAVQELVSMAPASHTGVVLGLGDFIHSDTNDARTQRSGAPLDTDTRYAKVLDLGIQLLVDSIDLALQKHERVIVRILPGNHDPYAALALTAAIAMFYSNNPRVFVDRSPSPFFWHKFGQTFIAAAHGDGVKPQDFPGFMAATQPKLWGETKFRYALFGHVHHRSLGGGERQGVVWETFQTLAPKDAWHVMEGYTSGRSMAAITYHKDDGEKYRSYVRV